MNDALAGTQAPVLIALNPDTEPPPGALRALVDRLHAHPRTGLVVPRLLNADGTLQPSVHRFPSTRLAAVANLVPARALRGGLGRRYWIEGAADHRSSEPIDWAYGAVHVLRAEATGPRPYNERWFMYVEDLDLCWRLQREGWVVELAGDVTVPHVGNAAGQQHWGAGREARVWAATYDWAARELGPVAARAYAALNTVGALSRGLAQQSIGRVRHDPAARTTGRHLRAVARVHARGMVSPRAG
jgi:GT2 family glycosyltransferase